MTRLIRKSEKNAKDVFQGHIQNQNKWRIPDIFYVFLVKIQIKLIFIK